MTQKRRRRPKRSAAQWAELVAAWRDSGVSGRTFAAEQDVSETSLYRWASRLQPQAVQRPARQSFVAVQVSNEPRAKAVEEPGRMELVARGGRLIRVTAPIDPEALATVLQVLEQC